MSDSTQTPSHSELFGLKGQPHTGGSSQPAGSGPGSGVLGTSGHTGTNNSISEGAGAIGMSGKESKVGGMAMGVEGNSRPGAGSSILKPEQGSGKIEQ
jgi:hypothetical protein